MVERGAGARADRVDARHRDRRRGELAPRRDLPGQRGAGAGDKRQGNGVLGELHALQQQHRREPPHAQDAHRGAADLLPQGLHHFLAGLLAPLAVPAVLLRPHRRQFQIVGRGGQALGGPARHGHAIGIGVVHLLVQRKTALGQAVDHMQFPQRARAVQHGHVQLRNEVVQRLPVVVAGGELVIKNVLVQVHRLRDFPMRHGLQREIDDAIERCLDVGEAQVLAIEVFGKAGFGPARPLADQQARDMFGAGFGLGDEETEVKERQGAHGAPGMAGLDCPILQHGARPALRGSP